MDAETMNKKIIDLSDEELITLGYWGDPVEAAKAHPNRLGYLTCFMIECVKEQHAIPARGPKPAPQPPTSTIPTSPTLSNPETLCTNMNDSDAHTVLAPHLITNFERQFYYNGISGNPPELLYRSDLETNAFYVPTPGASFSKIPTKTPNGVFGSRLNLIWDDTVVPQIKASMKAKGIRYSALKTVRFTIVQDDKATIGPVVIWIAVKPNTTNAVALRDFTPDILRILSDSHITDVVVEYYEGEVTKLNGPPLVPVVNRKNPAFGLNHPFNTTLGIPIARQTPDDGQGTITFLFKEGKTRKGETSDKVLAVTNKHVACVDTKTDYRFDGTNPLPMLVCGDRQYERAVSEIKAAISNGVRQSAKLSKEIVALEAKKGTPDENSRSLRLLNKESQEIEEDNVIRQSLFVKATTEWKNPDDRKFGIVDYAPKVSVTMDSRRDYTFDVATIGVDPAKVLYFKSNIVDLGDQFGATELEDLFWPVKDNCKGSTIPGDLQLPILRALPYRQVVDPDGEDKNGEPLYVLAKYGSATKLTLGRYSGMDGYTCDEFENESREVVVYNYTGAHGLTGDFSNHGDSGSLIFTGHGDAFAMLHSGMPRGMHNHVTYGTPIWWIIEQILKEYPDADFFGMTSTTGHD